MQRVLSIRDRLALMVAAVCLGFSAPADTPWIQKPQNEWSRSDVQRILYDSPWAKRFLWIRKAKETDLPDQGPTAMELRGYHSKESRDDVEDSKEFFVRWVSSRTLRKASARRTTLLRQSPANSLENDSPLAMGEIEIAVTGRDMSDFENAREATLRAKCLLFASSRRKARALRVEIARSSDGRVRALLFRFPRTTAAGEPLISTHDGKVLFLSYGSEVEIRTTFNPQTMIDDKGSDL